MGKNKVLRIGVPMERLEELAEADKAGRVLILPDIAYTDADGEKAMRYAEQECNRKCNAVTRYIADAVAEKLCRDAEKESANHGKEGCGYWILDDEDEYARHYHCSICGAEIDLCSEIYVEPTPNYCSNCGTKMAQMYEVFNGVLYDLQELMEKNPDLSVISVLYHENAGAEGYVPIICTGLEVKEYFICKDGSLFFHNDQFLVDAVEEYYPDDAEGIEDVQAAYERIPWKKAIFVEFTEDWVVKS